MGSGSAGDIIRAKTPLRLSFAGGGTDFPHYYREHGGAVLSCTINRYTHVTIYPQDSEDITIRSLDLGLTVNYKAHQGPEYGGMLDLAKAAIRRMGIEGGMSIEFRSDAPPGSGLGSSSALTATLLGALAVFSGRVVRSYDLAELSYVVERIEGNIAGGKQDQYATTFGGFNLIEFYPDRVAVNPLRIEADILNDLEAHLLLCDTGTVRTDLGLIAEQTRLYEAKRKETLLGMKRLHELVFEMKDAVLTRRLDDFGSLLHESYVSKKRMNPDLAKGCSADLLYETAREHGAIGGKLCGAGGGGYLLLYCATGRQHELATELEKLGGTVSHFAFEGSGIQVWRSDCR